MSTDDLCYMSATEAIKEFRALSLSPVELLDAIINRAEAISESINPFADRYFDEALVRAKNAENLYLKKNSYEQIPQLTSTVKIDSEYRFSF